MIITELGEWDRRSIIITDLEKYHLCLNHRDFPFGSEDAGSMRGDR